MSRSGYSDDIDHWALIRWRGAVNSSIRGRRGQAFLRELLSALGSMPDKRLIAEDMQSECGVCALGAIAVSRGLDVSDLNANDAEEVAGVFGIAPALVREIVFLNDDWGGDDGPSFSRHSFMCGWVREHIEESNS